MKENTIYILLVEDNMENAVFFRENLLTFGKNEFDIQHVSSLSEAIEYLNFKNHIDIILLDLGLPDSYGIETFRSINKYSSQLPIVILTGIDDENIAIEAIKHGAQEYLLKSEIPYPLLSRTIKYAIERHKMLNQINALIENNVDGIMIVDKKGIIRFMNSAAAKLFKRPVNDMIGSSFGYEISENKRIEINIERENGNLITVEIRIVNIYWENDFVYLVSLRDISELVRLREELRAMAIEDGLTGLLNRRGFMTLGEQHLKLNKRLKQNLFLIFIDLDDLKIINDLLGHNMGDKALVEVSDLLRSIFRESDIIARIGGDEFAILSSKSPKSDLDTIKSRLRDNIDNINTDKNRRYSLSMSIGIVEYEANTEIMLEQLLARADVLMYQEKKEKASHCAK